MEEYLIDESLIVYLDRAEYPYHRQLTQFLEGGRRPTFFNYFFKKSPKKCRYTFYMPHSSRIRLKDYWYLKVIRKYKSIFGAPQAELIPLEKAQFRTDLSKSYVSKYFKLNPFKRWLPKELSDLFIYANDKKSKDLQENKQRKIEANELISLTTCEAVLIARKKGLKIVSFNEDYKYFQILPGKQTYITYIHPDDILKAYK